MKPKLTPLLFLVLLGMGTVYTCRLQWHCQKGIIGGSGGGPNEYIGDNGTNGTNTDQSNAKSSNIAANVSIHGAVIHNYPKPDDNVAGTSLEVCIMYV